MIPAAKPTPPQGSFEYRLERLPTGVVMLDLGRRITAVNSVALRLLRQSGQDALGVDILSIHPPTARPKVRWLLDAAENATDGTAGMVITTPVGSLVAKVTLLGSQGYCMIFHILGDMAMGGGEGEAAPRLLKIPVSRAGKTELVDVGEVACLSAQGHYAEALTRTGRFLCPLPLAELERRLDASRFVRVHRRHLVNLGLIRSVERCDGAWTLVLADQAASRVPVSRAKAGLVRRLLAV
jgi:hypothetical protein